jgi:cytochrome c oxidase subunit III
MADLSVVTASLPYEGRGLRSAGWWGMLCLIATEAILFVYLLFSYAYLGSQASGHWPPYGNPSLALALPDTAVLLGSSFVLGWGQRAFRQRGAIGALRIALLVTFVMGAVFVAVQALEWRGKPFTLDQDAYSAAYFTLTGIHMAHVVLGLAVLLALFVWSFTDRLGGRSQHVTLGALYWHFVDVVWIFLFTTIYILPRLS